MNKIEGKENLYKDPNSGAVVNADKTSYEMAKFHKRRILEEKEKQKQLEGRIERLERLIEERLS